MGRGSGEGQLDSELRGRTASPRKRGEGAELLLAAMLIVLAVMLALAVLPQMWVRRVIAAPRRRARGFPRHRRRVRAPHPRRDEARPRQGGGDRRSATTTIPTPRPSACCRSTSNGRSLSAVVIAAHEAGHAMQDASGYPPARGAHAARQAGDPDGEGRRRRHAGGAHRHGAGQGAPRRAVIEVFVGVMIFALSILLHAVTLPVEFDASFGRALPVLQGRPLPRRQGHAGGQGRSCAPPPSPTSPPPP